MKNVPKILIKTYLRRQPIHLRLSRFNFLTRYSWLKNLLEDLKPELFPEPAEDTAPKESLATTTEPSDTTQSLIQAKLQGKQGLYQVISWLGKRGNGHLFTGIQLSSKQPVVIKEYLLPANRFNPEETRQQQQAFANLAGFRHPDDRVRDIRVVRPLEAIVDQGVDQGIDDKLTDGSAAVKRCYLITDYRDACPSLRAQILEKGAFSAPQVRALLAQILQTLSILHQQKIILPSGQFQAGLGHGNLRLDTVLWVEENGHPFVYLSDFALWERIFEAPTRVRITSEATPENVAQDLEAAGRIGYSLLTGRVDNTADIAELETELTSFASTGTVWHDAFLESFLRRLLRADGAPFETAEAAWQTLLALPVLTKTVSQIGPTAEVQAPQRRRALPRSVLVGLGVSALAIAAGLVWFWIPKRQAEAVEDAPVCCLQEVGAVPTGRFVYATVEDGTWQSVLRQQNLGKRGQSLDAALLKTQPDLNLSSIPAASQAEAISWVQSGKVDFAVLPLLSPDGLPTDLSSQTIAYDGLAVVVPFSYAERARGLPRALGGELSLADLQTLYLGTVESWREVGGPWLPIDVYLADNPDVAAAFEQRVLYPVTLDSPAAENIEQLPTLEMLRTVIRDFESRQIGSLGLAPLSQIFGQCSVYPLAVKSSTQRAIQPWRLVTGEAISPTTDLCDRKGLYHPDVSVFQNGDYPLAYPIAVVYPPDNSRLPIGQKFAELLQTSEGQRLLIEAGLVPLREENAR
ncbi:MAG: phosphate ABC transporter substrate-binding protein [Cyanobacteria bacterium P01_A01_bin.114]